MKNVIYTPQLKDQLALIMQGVALLAKEVPDKCEEQLLAEIDFLRDRLEETKPLIGESKPAEKEDNNAPAGSTIGFETLKLSAGLKNEIENLINNADIKRLNRNLRKMLQLYLANEKTGVPLDFDDFMIDLYFLHELLDVVEDEGGRALNAAS